MRHDRMLLAVAGAAVLTLAGPSPPGAQPAHCEHEVGGTVFRRVGRLLEGPSHPAGVPGVALRLLGLDGAAVAETRTGPTGRYSFTRICPGSYVVCPGVPCPAGALGSRYAPPTQDIVLPRARNTTIDFRQLEPPHVASPDPANEKRFIEIDGGIREARDLELAKKVREFVRKTLTCPDEASCRLSISVSNGHVRLRGSVPAAERARLQTIPRAVAGVRTLDLEQVKGKEQP